MDTDDGRGVRGFDETCFCSSCGVKISSFKPDNSINKRIEKCYRERECVVRINQQENASLLIALKNPLSPTAAELQTKIESDGLVSYVDAVDVGLLVMPKYVEGYCSECKSVTPINIETEFGGVNVARNSAIMKMNYLKSLAGKDAMQKFNTVFGNTPPSVNMNADSENHTNLRKEIESIASNLDEGDMVANMFNISPDKISELDKTDHMWEDPRKTTITYTMENGSVSKTEE